MSNFSLCAPPPGGGEWGSKSKDTGGGGFSVHPIPRCPLAQGRAIAGPEGGPRAEGPGLFSPRVPRGWCQQPRPRQPAGCVCGVTALRNPQGRWSTSRWALRLPPPPTAPPGAQPEPEGGRKPEVWRGLLTQEGREVAEENRVWNSSPPPPPAACQEGIILDYPAVSSHPRGRPQPGRGIHFRGCGLRAPGGRAGLVWAAPPPPGSSPAAPTSHGGAGWEGMRHPRVGERPGVAPAGSGSPPWGGHGGGGAPSPIQGAQPQDPSSPEALGPRTHGSGT